MLFKETTLSILSDEELLSLYKESSKKGYIEELFIRYLPLLYGVCLKYLNDSNKATNTVMQLFEDMSYTISDSEIDVFRPWIYDVIKNQCFQILRKEENFVTTDSHVNAMEYDNIFNLLEGNQDEQATVLEKYINMLPDRQRLSLTYFFTEGLSYAEIACKTGYTLKNVKNYILSGKQQLKNYMEN